MQEPTFSMHHRAATTTYFRSLSEAEAKDKDSAFNKKKGLRGPRSLRPGRSAAAVEAAEDGDERAGVSPVIAES